MNIQQRDTVLSPPDFPPLLREITDPPTKLFMRGSLPPSDYRYLAVVGSRSYSPYAKDACERLIGGLAGYPIVIISGLALGIDGVAHNAAMRFGLPTIAVPGSGLNEEVLYPRAHLGLSREIIQKGGALLSELPGGSAATIWTFPKRNRLMAGMSHAVLVIEAREKSGTLITARLGMEYNRDVLVVPAPLFSPYGEGSNKLLRQGGQIVTSSVDILEAVKLGTREDRGGAECALGMLENEKIIFEKLAEPLYRDELIRASGMQASEAQVIISAMEIKGFVGETLGKVRRLL